jgi:hypothetical protein
MPGLTVWGEASAFHAAIEMSYLAFARFTCDLRPTWDHFVLEEIAPRVGGEVAANRFLEITGLLDSEDPIEPTELRRLPAEVVDASHQTNYDAGRRWFSLADRIALREMNGRHSGI